MSAICFIDCANSLILHVYQYYHVLLLAWSYQYFRHPSYVGYFYWAVGTQIHLCNPISFILYLNAAWTFFSIRIPYEESTLLYQYGEEYREYMKNTWVGIPLIPSKIPESTNPPNKMDWKTCYKLRRVMVFREVNLGLVIRIFRCLSFFWCPTQ